MALTWTYYPQDSDPSTVPNFKDSALNNPGVTPDRMFNSSDVADSNIRTGGKGVVRGYANEFAVTQSVTSTTQLEVQSGTANCWGYTLTGKGDFDTIDVLTLPANANRIDVLVLKFDPSSTRTNYLTWHQGIEASSPIAPDVGEYEIALANVELEPINGIVSVDDTVTEYLLDVYTKNEVDSNFIKNTGSYKGGIEHTTTGIIDNNNGKQLAYEEEQVLLFSGEKYLEDGDTFALDMGAYDTEDFKEIRYYFSDYNVGQGARNVDWTEHYTKRINVGNFADDESSFYGYQMLTIGNNTNGSGGGAITKAWNLNRNATITGRTVESSEEKDAVLRIVIGILK